MKKSKIKIADLLEGEVYESGVRKIIPFNTNRSEFDPEWENIPRIGSLVFTINENREYVFSGIEIICYCENCRSKREAKEQREIISNS